VPRTVPHTVCGTVPGTVCGTVDGARGLMASLQKTHRIYTIGR